MKRRPILLFTSLFLFGFILFLLISGSPILNVPLSHFGGYPAGNLLTWIGYLLLPFSIYLAIFSGKQQEDPRLNIFRMGLLVSFVLSLLWGVLAYGLAGNWQYTFSGQAEQFVGSPTAGEYFWYVNYLTAGWPLFVGLLYLGYRVAS